MAEFSGISEQEMRERIRQERRMPNGQGKMAFSGAVETAGVRRGVINGTEGAPDSTSVACWSNALQAKL